MFSCTFPYSSGAGRSPRAMDRLTLGPYLEHGRWTSNRRVQTGDRHVQPNKPKICSACGGVGYCLVLNKQDRIHRLPTPPNNSTSLLPRVIPLCLRGSSFSAGCGLTLLGLCLPTGSTLCRQSRPRRIPQLYPWQQVLRPSRALEWGGGRGQGYDLQSQVGIVRSLRRWHSRRRQRGCPAQKIRRSPWLSDLPS